MGEDVTGGWTEQSPVSNGGSCIWTLVWRRAAVQMAMNYAGVEIDLFGSSHASDKEHKWALLGEIARLDSNILGFVICFSALSPGNGVTSRSPA